jgi:hypothetical protein
MLTTINAHEISATHLPFYTTVKTNLNVHISVEVDKDEIISEMYEIKAQTIEVNKFSEGYWLVNQ